MIPRVHESIRHIYSWVPRGQRNLLAEKSGLIPEYLLYPRYSGTVPVISLGWIYHLTSLRAKSLPKENGWESFGWIAKKIRRVNFF
jgi:hypothetical protein